MLRLCLSARVAIPLLSASLLLSGGPALGQDSTDPAPVGARVGYGFEWQAPTKGKGDGVNRPQAGTTVPVTFALATKVKTTEVMELGWPKVRRVDCSTKAPIAGTQWRTRPFGAAGLTRVGTSYTYAWRVRAEWGDGPLACRELRMKLTDGTTHSALYRFTRATPPDLTLTPSSSEADPIMLAPGEIMKVVVRNEPGSPSTGALVVSLAPNTGTGFTITKHTCTAALGSGRSCSVTVIHGPDEPSASEAVTVTVRSTKPNWARAPGVLRDDPSAGQPAAGRGR